MSRSFMDQIVWITGASAGIGRAMAHEFARHGAKVAVTGRRAERLAEVVAELKAAGTDALAVPLDVTDDAAVESAVSRIAAEYGRLDVVVANAGFGVGGRIEKLSTDDWRRQFETNVFGLVSTVRFALPELRKTRGRVALVGSVSSILPAPGFGAYTASKYAVRAIGQTLALELHGSGVTCTNIYPGFVESEIAQVDNNGVFDETRKDKRPSKLMWPTDKAATVMVKAIRKRKREYVFTGHGKVGAFLGQHMPGFVHFAMTRAGGKQKAKIEAAHEK